MVCGILMPRGITHFVLVCTWHKKGFRYINDLVNEQGQIQSFEQIKTQFVIPGSYLDYMGLMQSIPSEWRIKTVKV